MSQKQERKFPNWLVVSKTQPGSDPILETMKQLKIPLTRENYLEMAFPDEDLTDLPPEYEMQIPEQFRQS